MAPVKNYTPEQMARAIEAVKRGDTVGSAAKKYGVPRITLRNKITGKSPAFCTMGPSTILAPAEEKLLIEWMFAMSERHCPVSKEQLLDSVQHIINLDKRHNPFTDNRPGKKWYAAFLRRHPELTERVTQNLTKSRDNITEKNVRAWFAEVLEYLKGNNLQDAIEDPNRVFNTDESAFFLNPSGGRVLVKRGDKNVYSVSGNEKENVTVLVTANAAGQLAPPMVVLAYERVPGFIANSMPEEWGIGRSETGWMCGRTFYEYITNVFYPWLLQSGTKLPIVFFLDGHASHLTLHLSNFCAQHRIELVSLYPNSTHLLQPMDVAVFHPLKVFYRKNVTKWKSENPGKTVKKENFGHILQNSLRNMTADCIKNGFRAGGLFPFGPDYVDFSKLNKKNRIEEESHQSPSSCSPQDQDFFVKLETEIVELFGVTKLNLYKNLFYVNRDELENQLHEDVSLFTLWAKFKHRCHILSQPVSSESFTASSSSTTAVTNVPVDDSAVPISSIEESTAINSITFATTNMLVDENPKPYVSPIKPSTAPSSIASVVTNELMEEITVNKCSKKRSTASNSSTDIATNMVIDSNDVHINDTEKSTATCFSNVVDTSISLGRNAVILNSAETSTAQNSDSVLVPNESANDQQSSAEAGPSDFTNLDQLSEEMHKTPLKCPTSTSFSDYLQTKSNITVPSPFKKALFWPEPEKKKRRITKEKIPAVVTSSSWRIYHERKELLKKEKEQEKEKKKAEREKKKRIRNLDLEKRKDKTTMKGKGSGKGRQNKQKASKGRQNSESSDEARDSDVTYVETGESEQDFESEENSVEVESEMENMFVGTYRRKFGVVGDSINIDNTEKNKEKEILPLRQQNPPKINILEQAQVKVVLDEKTGTLRAITSHTFQSELPSNGDYILASFDGAKGKKKYKYVCLIQDISEDKLVVQGFKSFKTKDTFQIIPKDISIINKSDVICILPQPIRCNNNIIIFPASIDVKEI